MSAKVKITIESGKHLPDQPKPDHGMIVAWAELNGRPISGQLAAHNNREVAEHQAADELARRLRRALATGPGRGAGQGSGGSGADAPRDADAHEADD